MDGKRDVKTKEETPMDLPTMLDKISQYTQHIYVKSRMDGGESGVRKYSRKLKRLTARFDKITNGKGE